MPVAVPINLALMRELENSLHMGPMLDADGLRFFNEEQVARSDGLSIQIQADEHPPLHFHVRGGAPTSALPSTMAGACRA